MHGLRCSPAIPGFTRLLDEWVVGLTRYATHNAAVFDDPATFADTFAAAITRVRAFAYPAGEAPETRWGATGVRFELQGHPYVATRDSLTVTDPSALAEAAETAMRRAAAAARAALDAAPVAPPEAPVAAPVASPEAPAAPPGGPGEPREPEDEPIPVGLVFVRVAPDPLPTDPAARETLARAFRDVTRQLGTTGAAWSFPTAAEGPEYHYTGPSTLGGLVLALRAEP